MYLAGNQNLSPELIGTLTRQANSNLLKQNDAAVQRLLESVTKVADAWEVDDTTTTPIATQAPTTEAMTTQPQTESPTTQPGTEEPTTLGASSLSIHLSLLLMLWAVISLLK